MKSVLHGCCILVLLDLQIQLSLSNDHKEIEDEAKVHRFQLSEKKISVSSQAVMIISCSPITNQEMSICNDKPQSSWTAIAGGANISCPIRLL